MVSRDYSLVINLSLSSSSDIKYSQKSNYNSENMDESIEKEIQIIAQTMAENAETVQDIRDAFILLNKKPTDNNRRRIVPTFITS
jgi:hypothetical protein